MHRSWRVVVCLAMGTFGKAGALAGQAPPATGARLIVDNEWVTVRELSGVAAAGAWARERDVVRVSLDPATTGAAVFRHRGSSDAGAADWRAERFIEVELKDRPMTSYPNTSGHPPAFPRPGVRKPVANGRVVVWDYTFVPNVPSPLHFHDRDVVVVFLGEGTLASTTEQGAVTTRDHTNGMILFNLGNRVHTETLVRGEGRVLVIELR